MDGVKHCWICGGEFLEPFPIRGDRVEIDCTLCGVYQVTGSVVASAFPLAEGERYRLSHWVRARQLDGRSAPVFDSTSMHVIVRALPQFAPHEKLDVLLQSMSKLSATAGAWFRPDLDRNYSLACAVDRDEFSYFLLSLVHLGLLERHSSAKEYRLSPSGWLRLAALPEAPGLPRVAFVAMRFIDEMLRVFETSMKPAIEAAGFKAEISGNPAHNERIDARIMAQIKAARFVVADVTHENQGVYFEAGYALGLGRPVIWTCRADRLGALHFDTRQYNHIVWRESQDLESQLRDRIIATI